MKQYIFNMLVFMNIPVIIHFPHLSCLESLSHSEGPQKLGSSDGAHVTDIGNSFGRLSATLETFLKKVLMSF